MSRRVHRAELALASDGTALLNITTLVDDTELDALLDIAKEEKGRVFIGVELDAGEAAPLLRRLQHGVGDAVGKTVGARRWRRRGRRSV